MTLEQQCILSYYKEVAVLNEKSGVMLVQHTVSARLYVKKTMAVYNKDIYFYDYYIDDGYSGTDFNRPGIKSLLKDMKESKFNTVIVKDLSRLGRNYIEVGNYIEQVFPLFNIRFIAVNDSIDSFKDPSSVNNVIVPFKNLLNDEYCRDLSNKVRSVLNVKKRNGEYVNSFVPYGYLKDPKDKHHLIVDPEAAKVVKMIDIGNNRGDEVPLTRHIFIR